MLFRRQFVDVPEATSSAYKIDWHSLDASMLSLMSSLSEPSITVLVKKYRFCLVVLEL